MMRISQDDARRRISELEASNQSLGHQASELRVNSQDQAAQYESKVSHECWLKLLTTTLFSWRARTRRSSTSSSRLRASRGSTRRSTGPSWRIWPRSGSTAASSCPRYSACAGQDRDNNSVLLAIAYYLMMI